jgi:hypothetical protein
MSLLGLPNLLNLLGMLNSLGIADGVARPKI